MGLANIHNIRNSFQQLRTLLCPGSSERLVIANWEIINETFNTVRVAYKNMIIDGYN